MTPGFPGLQENDYYYLTKNRLIMDYKKSLFYLLASLILSPIVVYLVLFAARATGASYEMTHGETFIIWLLMAIVINLSLKPQK